MKSNTSLHRSSTPKHGSFLVHGYEGLTSDSVLVKVETRPLPQSMTRADVLASLPVSDDICATFTQRAQFVRRVVEDLESKTEMRFSMRSDGVSTFVWRQA